MKNILSCLIVGLFFLKPSLASLPSYCSLPSVYTKILHTFPRDGKFLDNIAWLSNPVPNSVGLPYLISFSQFMEDGKDKNYILNLASGKTVTIPGQGDPVVTPDGKFLTIPGAHSGESQLLIFLTKTVLRTLLKKEAGINSLEKIKPLFVDPKVEGYCQSFGVLPSKKGTIRYRLLHTEGGGPFQLTEYEVHEKNGKFEFKNLGAMQVCSNMPNSVHDNGTAILSKDGRYVSLYDSQAQSTKIFELEVAQGKCSCKEAVDFGFPTGRVDFSYDGKKITFHVNFLGIDYADNYVLKVPASKIKDVFVAELDYKNGKITGIKKMARLTASQKMGEGSYFPTFLPNGKIFYVYQDNSDQQDRKYRLEVVDSRSAKYEENLFSKLDSEKEQARFLSKVALGRLWSKACEQKILTPIQSALYAMSLDTKSCQSVVRGSWSKYKSQILVELTANRNETSSRLKKIKDSVFRRKIFQETLLAACRQ